MAGIAGCANAGKTERGIRKTMSDSKTINENGKENPEQLRELIESLNNEITRLKSRNEELEAEKSKLEERVKFLERGISCVEYLWQEKINRLTSALARAHEALEQCHYEFWMEDGNKGYSPDLNPSERMRKISAVLSDPSGSLAFEKWKKMEVICKKSVGWWLGKRPTNYTKQMHLENPDINCPTKSEQKLAKAVAEFEALDAKGEME